MRLKLTRRDGCFVSATRVSTPWGDQVHPRLCAGATTRAFGLTPGHKHVAAVFTKCKPRCKKFYELVSVPRDYHHCTPRIILQNFDGHFHTGVADQLKRAYNSGLRYVRIEER